MNSFKLISHFKALFEPYRYKIFYGGRGAGKSMQVARALVLRMAKKKIVVRNFREFKNSIGDSCKEELENAISEGGLDGNFKIGQRKIDCLNGSACTFHGLARNLVSIKSLTNSDIIWVEEAENVSEYSWDILIPTIRKEWSEIWITFNPESSESPTYQRFVVNTPQNAYKKKVNYYDNPYFPAVLEEERQECKKRTPIKYLRIWEGEVDKYEDCIVRPEWWRYYDDKKKVLDQCTTMFLTADTAYKEKEINDYTVIQLWGAVEDKKLYLLEQWRYKWVYPELLENSKKIYLFLKNNPNNPSIIGFYIEDKASGTCLIQDLLHQGIKKAIFWKPTDYGYPLDKIGRVNATSDLIYRGVMQIPSPAIAPWIKGFVKEWAAIGELKQQGNPALKDLKKDQVDAGTMAGSIFQWYGGGR